MPSSTSNSKSALFGYGRTALNVAIALALVAVVAAVRGAPSGGRGDSGVPEAQFWTDKALSQGPFDLVIAGDSRGYRGVAPEVLSSNMGLRTADVLNFCFSAGAYDERYLARLDELAADSGRLVLLISPGSLAPNSLSQNGFLQWDDRVGALRGSEYARLKHRITAPIERVARLPHFAPVTDRMLKQMLAVGPRGPRVSLQEFMPTLWVASNADPVDLGFFFEWFEIKFVDNRVSSAAVDALIDRVAVWRERDIAVFALRMPITEGLREIEDRRSGMLWDEFVERFAGAGGEWLDFPAGDYATFDGSHLDADNARRFSADLAERLGP